MNTKNLLFTFALTLATARAQQEGPCTLILPENPLTSKGLSTPWIYRGCDQTNPDQASFAEAIRLNTVTGELAVYTPLIVNEIDPTPLFPMTNLSVTKDHIVAVWFGSNANVLVLNEAVPGTLTNASCINGGGGVGNLSDPFGQVAACNAVAFFKTANALIARGLLKIPPLGMGLNGKPCYTTRSFEVVDQDPSDNVNSVYLTNGLRIGQFTQENALHENVTSLDNGSDNRLLDVFINPSLNCESMKILDLITGEKRGTQATNELQASAFAVPPLALVQPNDPMVLTQNVENLNKLNAYRSVVNQPPFNTSGSLYDNYYCFNLINTGLLSIVDNEPYYRDYQSPDPNSDLFDFLLARLKNSVLVLNCTLPFEITTNGNVNNVKRFQNY